MIVGLTAVILINVVVIIGVVDRINWPAVRIDFRAWAWPNDQRTRWRHSAKHRPRPPRGAVGAARQTVEEVIARLNAQRAELAAEVAWKRAMWIPLDVTP